MTTSLSIAGAAQATGLSVHTLRYYEQIGLIAPVERRSGARRYGEDDMRWLAFLVRLKSTGMSMRDMVEYARLLRLGATAESIERRRQLLEQHAERVKAQMGMLAETLETIQGKIRNYCQTQPVSRAAAQAAPGPGGPAFPPTSTRSTT